MKRFFIFALLAFVLGWWLGRRAEKNNLSNEAESLGRR